MSTEYSTTSPANRQGQWKWNKKIARTDGPGVIIDAMYLLILKYEGKFSVREWNRVLLDIGEKPIGCMRKPGDKN